MLRRCSGLTSTTVHADSSAQNGNICLVMHTICSKALSTCTTSACGQACLQGLLTAAMAHTRCAHAMSGKGLHLELVSQQVASSNHRATTRLQAAQRCAACDALTLWQWLSCAASRNVSHDEAGQIWQPFDGFAEGSAWRCLCSILLRLGSSRRWRRMPVRPRLWRCLHGGWLRSCAAIATAADRCWAA